MISIIDYFEERVQRYGTHSLIWEKQDGQFRPTTYQEAHKKVSTLAAGLLSLGIEKSERLALMSEGRNYWLISELAMLYCGAINVPLSTKLEADQDLVFRLSHSETKIVFTSKQQLPKIRAVLNELPNIEKIVVLDDISDVGDKEILLSDVIRDGE
ncbi:MAG: AMP-binding protein, partial [Bacteroidota bacterium]